MALTETTAPTVEPVSRNDMKTYLCLDTTSDDISEEQTIVPADHPNAAAFSLEGATVTVTGFVATAFLNAGDCTGTTTVDVKLQESNDDIAWTDVTDGAFTQVDNTNDNAIQELAYTGGFTYLRAVATVVRNTAAEFSVSITKQALTTDNDALIDSLITSARRQAENFTNRSFITTTWKLSLESFSTIIELPRPFAILVATVKYYDVDNAQQTLAAANYQADYESEPGRITLAYGYSWPDVYDRLLPIEVNYTAGYGAAATDVPDDIITAIKLQVDWLFENRENPAAPSAKLMSAAESLLWPYRVF